jgi:ATP-dependent Clp protease ATP-binding subunit ClpC
VRRQPFSVVLLDEIEKAHPDIYNTFLQVLDDGRLTDGLGRTVDFRRVILIMTSNTGFNTGGSVGFQRRQGRPVAPQDDLRPEFLDRLDEVIAFQTFNASRHLRTSPTRCSTRSARNSRRATSRHASAPRSPSFLVERLPRGESARPLRAVLREHVEDPLSVELLARGGEEPILVTVEGGRLVFARPVPIA